MSDVLPSPSPHRSRVLALILTATSMSLCLKSSLVIRPHSAQARGRLGPKTTEDKWVSGSISHPRHEKRMFHVSPWLDPHLGIPQPISSPACSSSSHLPAPSCNPINNMSSLTPSLSGPSLPLLSARCPLGFPHLDSHEATCAGNLSLGLSSSVSLPQSLREPQFPSPLE